MTKVKMSEGLALSARGRDCAVLTVGGMTCGACANAVQTVLARVPGVVSAEVDLGAGRAMVLGAARPQDLIAAVEGAGFDAAMASAAQAPATGSKPGRGCCCG